MPSKTFTNKVTDINGETQEVVERQSTLEEIAAQELLAQEALSHLAALETLKQQRVALLNRLGITEEEARLLLG